MVGKEEAKPWSCHWPGLIRAARADQAGGIQDSRGLMQTEPSLPQVSTQGGGSGHGKVVLGTRRWFWAQRGGFGYKRWFWVQTGDSVHREVILCTERWFGVQGGGFGHREEIRGAQRLFWEQGAGPGHGEVVLGMETWPWA